jgi:PPOX class probable F420-dependent enzyme
MPGYGIEDEKSGKGLLPWSYAVERLTGARGYWIATTRPDGRPHSMPIWGIWFEDAFFFSSGTGSRKSRNLARNPNCVLSVEPADEAIILEGLAELVDDADLKRRFAVAYQAKYQWPMDEFDEPVYRVRPSVVFAFTTKPEEFTNSATRWTFE